MLDLPPFFLFCLFMPKIDKNAGLPLVILKIFLQKIYKNAGLNFICGFLNILPPKNDKNAGLNICGFLNILPKFDINAGLNPYFFKFYIYAKQIM